MERAQRQQQQRQGQRSRQAQPPAPVTAQPVNATEVGDRIALSQREAFPKAGVVARTPVLGAVTRADLRKAIVMSEILQPPVAVRPPGNLGHHFPG